MPGGTLLFYLSRVFTAQVAGFGSRLKHVIGRGRMLSKVAANLKRDREQLKKQSLQRGGVAGTEAGAAPARRRGMFAGTTRR